MEEDREVLLETRRYLWDYFEMHAAQRLRTFHFYLIMCAVVVTGYLAVLREGWAPGYGMVLGALSLFFSFVFCKLDRRTSDMIGYAEEGLTFVEQALRGEEEGSNPAIVGIFAYEDAHTKEKRKRPIWKPWQYYLTYMRCFRLVFMVMAFLGVGAVVYHLVVIIAAGPTAGGGP